MNLKRPKLAAQLTCVAVFALRAWVANAAIHNFHLNSLDFGVDEQTGGLVYLSYSATGVILRTSPDSAGLLDLAYPTESFVALRLASRFSKARLVKNTDGLTIAWDELGPSRPNVNLPSGKVSAQVTIRAAGDGRSVILSCRIDNRSAAPIPQVMFPDLHGLKPFDGVERTQLRLARGVVQPFKEGLRPDKDNYYYYYELSWRSYPPGGYYSVNALRWLDYGSLRGGLSIFQKRWGTEERPGVRIQRRESDPMSLRLLWEHKTAIQAGTTWESGEFWLTPHRGGWAKGIEVYRDYVRQVSPPGEMARSVRDGLGFQTIWMMEEFEHDPSRAIFRYTDLPRVAEDARKYGIDKLDVWEWCGFSPPMPIPLRPELGTPEEFVEAVRRAKQMDVDVVPHVTLILVLNRYAARYGAKPSTSSSDDWSFHSELIPPFRPGYTRPWLGPYIDNRNEAWQRDVLSALTEWINRGVVSWSWDSFITEPLQDGKSALVTLIEKVRSAARAKDPESTFWGESENLEVDGAVLDSTWNTFGYVEAGPILNVLRVPRLNCMVEDSPRVVKKGFADGLYLNVIPRHPDQPNGSALISEKPALAAALKEVAPLRRQFLPFFVEGTFIGDSVLSEPASAFVRGYQLGDTLLVIMLNDRSEPQYVTVQSELSLWLPAGPYRFSYYDSRGKLAETTEGEGARWSGVTRLLQPLELAFFVIRAQSGQTGGAAAMRPRKSGSVFCVGPFKGESRESREEQEARQDRQISHWF